MECFWLERKECPYLINAKYYGNIVVEKVKLPMLETLTISTICNLCLKATEIKVRSGT